MFPDHPKSSDASNCWQRGLVFLTVCTCLFSSGVAPAQQWDLYSEVATRPEVGQAFAAPSTYPAPVRLPVVPSTCPEPVRLPVVPTRKPRVATGSETGQNWQTQLDPNAPPTASFVDAITGNDAILELVVNQGRLLTLKGDVSTEQGSGVIAVADPSVVEFDMLKPRIVRLTGRRVGVTDLSILTADGQAYNFEVRVGYDLELLDMQLSQVFPDADIRLQQVREHVVIEGQARSMRQVDQILETLEAFLASVQVPSSTEGTSSGGAPAPSPSGRRGAPYAEPNAAQDPPSGAPGFGGDDLPRPPRPELGSATPDDGEVNVEGSFVPPRIINLLRIPGVHQVMLQVQLAEVNRTGLREVGADILRANPGVGNILATQIGGAAIGALAAAAGGGVSGSASGAMNSNTQAVGVFPSGDVSVFLRALRRNQLATILAEPNLVAMSGQQASFLAGGEFPVPVPQSGAATGAITIEYKKFGVQLDFVPYVLEDETIRLSVRPEASTIDQSVSIVTAGVSVPGINTRTAATTVEMRQGQTLGIAGLLNVTIEGSTSRIPLLGDLPYLGPLFSNTTQRRVEKELLILVTPYLVAPMNADQVPCLPGQEIEDPNDLEFYLLNRIEGRTGRGHHSTRNWDDPLGLVRLLHLEQRCVSGPVGFSPWE
jgi:pilus assembly protein CpaC